MQVAGARVIAEPGPGPQNILKAGGRERPDCGPLRQEPRVVRRHRLDCRLLQHDFGQPDTIWICQLSRPRPPWQHARMPVIPGEKIGRLRTERFLPRRRLNCYGHGADDGIRPGPMSKSSHSFPRPLSELLSATLSDVLKAQGFASTEIISRWNDIVGPEIAGHSEPLKIKWPRATSEEKPEPATLVLRVEGPAALEIQHLSGSFSKGSIASSAGRPLAGSPSGKLPSGVGNRRRSPNSMTLRPRRSPRRCRTSRMTTCVRRSLGWVRRSREIELFEWLGRRACHCHNCPVQLANRLKLTGA